MRRCDADGHPDRHTHNARGEYQSEAFSCFFPIALVENKKESEPDKQTGFPAALHQPSERNKSRDNHQWMWRLKNPKKAIDHGFKNNRQ